jgi:hypothetical protein
MSRLNEASKLQMREAEEQARLDGLVASEASRLDTLEAQGEQTLQQMESSQLQSLMQADLQAFGATTGAAIQQQQIAQDSMDSGFETAGDTYEYTQA